MADIGDLTAGTLLGSSSLVELATEALRREILAGVLGPGERIVEEALTRRYGVSRGPVREALRLLAQQGLVEHSPRRGVRVATMSPQDVDELYALRDVLERYAVTVAFPPAAGDGVDALRDRPDFPDLGPVREALAAMRATGRARLGTQMAQAHQLFHVALVGLAGQRQLLMAYEPVLLKLQLYMAANLGREARVAAPLDGVLRHERLLVALESGDAAVALAELTEHGARSYLP